MAVKETCLDTGTGQTSKPTATNLKPEHGQQCKNGQANRTLDTLNLEDSENNGANHQDADPFRLESVLV